MKVISMMDNLVRRYEGNPVIRGLVQLFPYGSAIEGALLTTIQNIRHDRLKTFFDELAGGNIEITPELIESEDFLHAYYATVKATLNTRRREKIKMFANLLKTSFHLGLLQDIDEYEEFLRLLDEMSFRELSVLLKLYKYENRRTEPALESDRERADSYWDDFVAELVQELGIKDNEVSYYLQRLERTGCYEKFEAPWGNDKKSGHLTTTFYRLKEMIVYTTTGTS